MKTLRGDGREHTMKLTAANYEWLRERAHRERKSQALVLNEALDAARAVDAERRKQEAWYAAQARKEGGGDG